MIVVPNQQGTPGPCSAIVDLYKSFLADALVLTPFNHDSVWIETGDNVRSGIFRGQAEIGEHSLHCRQMTDGTLGTDVLEVLGGHNFVVVVERALALRNGTSLNMLCNTVFEIANGSIAEMRKLPFDPMVWDEFWS